MRTITGLLVPLFILAGTGFSQSIFDIRTLHKSIKSYRDFLEQTRLKLYADNGDLRAETLYVLQEAAQKPITDGDSLFPLAIMADLVIGEGAPENAEIDGDLQEEALEFIVEQATEDESALSHREIAVDQLSRIAAADQLADFELSEQAVDALVDLAASDNAIVAHAALVGLGRVTGKHLSDWEDLAGSAAEAIMERMDDTGSDMQRIAINQTVKLLGGARESTEARQALWAKLTETLTEIESQSLRQELGARTRALIAKMKGSASDDQAAALDEALKEMKGGRHVASGSLATVLQELRDESDPLQIDAYLAKVERDATGRRVSMLQAVSALAVIATGREIPAFKLRRVTDVMLGLAFSAQSSLMYYRTASLMMELVSVHRKSPLAAVPLAQLSRLMASTEQTVLVFPVIAEVHALAAADLPHWIRRRLVALLFMQAGDGLLEVTRRQAFESLSALGGPEGSWGVRMEVLTRMEQLARLAKHSEIQSSAAQWN